MKIAITGAQSTGKSTLLKALKRSNDLYGFEFIDELTGQIAAKGININEEGSNMSQIFTVTIHAENIMKKHFISDRCALDGLVYTKWLYDQGKVDQWIMDYALGVAKEVLPRYDYIFYLPPEIPIEDDGVRSSNEKFRDEIVALFEKYTRELDVKLIELTGSVKERADKFRSVIGPKLALPVQLDEVDLSTVFDYAATFNTEYITYLKDAIRYWVKEGYEERDDCKILQTEYSMDFGIGTAFIRQNSDGSVHLSRFTTSHKGKGLGSRVFSSLKLKYGKVTLWSNPEAMEFYKRNGVTFTEETTDVDGSTYTYGYYENV